MIRERGCGGGGGVDINMLFKEQASPHVGVQEESSKIKANFMDQEIRQMQSYIEDLELSCRTNKEIL